MFLHSFMIPITQKSHFVTLQLKSTYKTQKWLLMLYVWMFLVNRLNNLYNWSTIQNSSIHIWEQDDCQLKKSYHPTEGLHCYKESQVLSSKTVPRVWVSQSCNISGRAELSPASCLHDFYKQVFRNALIAHFSCLLSNPK